MTHEEMLKIKRMNASELSNFINEIKLTEYKKALNDYAEKYNDFYCKMNRKNWM